MLLPDGSLQLLSNVRSGFRPKRQGLDDNKHSTRGSTITAASDCLAPMRRRPIMRYVETLATDPDSF